MKVKMLAAAAVVAAAITTPAMAQDSVQPRAAVHTRAYDSNAYYSNAYYGGDDWNHRNGDWDRRDNGFWPGEFAAGVVGGAVGTAGAIAGGAIGTAGAIATAPFRANSYAYNGNATSFNGPSGFVCQPGTWFRGEDGRRHICQ